MGSFIEINDTLRISREQGFPAELDYNKHVSTEGGYYNAKMFEGRVFEFKEKPGVRIYKLPPVRNFLVEYTKDGKWLYWGMCHILETTCDYQKQTTAGKFKIIYINTPEEMKTTFNVVDRVWKNDFFNRIDGREVKSIITNARSLSRVSTEILPNEMDVLKLKQEMQDSLNSTDGSGIAAPQIGVYKRAILVKEKLNDGKTREVFIINPKITSKSGSLKLWEFCLSVPNTIGKVSRPRNITIEGLDENFKPIRITSTGTFAGLYQHEVEHLDGIVYTNRATEVKKAKTKKDAEQLRNIVLSQKLVF